MSLHSPRPSRVLPNHPSRRVALASIAATAMTVAGGCRDNAAEPSEVSTGTGFRTDIPLRIVLVGSESEAESIRQTWATTMEQGVEIEVVDHFRSRESAESDQDWESNLADKVAAADIAIVPQVAVGTIKKRAVVVPLSESNVASLQESYGPLLPAVENGIGAYGSDVIGVPLGAKLFALLTTEANTEITNWAQYHRWVAELGGAAAEPLADGWAASTFLHRCATTIRRGWLFERKGMKPILAQQDHVDVLAQMAETAAVYQGERRTPAEIWRGLRDGSLKGGIGFEVPIDDASAASEEEFDVLVQTGPNESAIERLWFDPNTPLAIISDGCRQTEASKQFIGWIAGDTSSDRLKRQVGTFSRTRRVAEENVAQESAYARWLGARLGVLQAVTPLCLPSATEYYRALDEAIVACVTGTVSAGEALQRAHDQWEIITSRVGRDQQGVAWRRAMGFGA